MYDEILAEALINKEHRVMRRTLRPFCLWHRFQFEVAKSPLFTGNRAVTWADIDLAVNICRTRYGETARPSHWIVKQWYGAGLSIREELVNFNTYLKDHCSYPQFWSYSNGGGNNSVTTKGKHGRPKTTDTRPRKGGMPSELSIVARNLALGSAADVPAAWEMSLGLAHWYAAAYTQLSGGDLDFESPFFRDLKRKDKERQQKAAAQAAALKGGGNSG